MEGLLAFIAFLASVFGIFYVFVTTRNKERMSLIEKGAEASLFDSMNVMEHGAEYTSMVFLFGGLSLVLFYLIDRKN